MEIRMEKEQDIVNKKINLHVTDIRRIQGAVSNINDQKGKYADDLKRRKIMTKRTTD